MSIRLLLLLLCILLAGQVMAQRKKHRSDPPVPDLTFPLETIYAERKPERLRKLLHHLTVSPSLTIGSAGWSHALNDGVLYRKSSGIPRLFVKPLAPQVRALPSWISSTDVVDLSIGSIDPDEFLISADTARLVFSGRAGVVNAGLRLSTRIWKIRVGIGWSLERFSPVVLRPNRYAQEIGSTSSGSRSITGTAWSVTADYEFLRRRRLGLAGQVRMGTFNWTGGFTAGGFTPSLTYGAGTEIRWNLSEYLQAFAQPVIDFRGYSITEPQTGISIRHRILSPALQVGVHYTFPELKKCYHKLCRVQMNHPHGNREYRSRAHPIYKKQSPEYGENHPEPVKTNRLKGPKAINP